jgi:hypothetical protein
MPLEAALKSLWGQAGADPALLDDLYFSDVGPALPSSYRVAELAASTIAAQAMAAAAIWQVRGGQSQRVEISTRRALAMFRSERYLAVDGKPPADVWDALAGFYLAGDGRWIQLHTNFPHHREGVLRLLRCENERSEVASAISMWRAADLAGKLAAEGLCAALIRTPAEWQAHPQAIALSALPLFEVLRVGDAPPEPFQSGATRPLSGVRVLDLSRVIAAPVAARTLAQHGADVLAVSAAHLPNIMPLVIDTGRGKRATQLDLREARGRDSLHTLIRDADVFLQAYRPGALAGLGFTSEELCRARPGLIQVSLSAYGHVGPWAMRRGFDSLVQSATGIAHEEGRAAGLTGPGKLPCQALDHATGYIAALGTMVALQKRAIEGGSWMVRVSLAQTGQWLQSMGRVQDGHDAPELSRQEVMTWRERIDSPFGMVSAIAPVEQMALTPARFERAPVPLDTDAAQWE